MSQVVCDGTVTSVLDTVSGAYVVQCSSEWVAVGGVFPDWDNLGPMLAAVMGLWAVAFLIRMARLAFEDTAA